MTDKLADRIRSRILEIAEMQSWDSHPEYPQASFEELNKAGMCKPFTTRIPVSTVKALEIVADATGHTRSELVHEMIMEAMEKICSGPDMAELTDTIMVEANKVILDSLEQCDTPITRAKRQTKRLKDKLL